MVGTYYSSSAPDAPTFVSVGSVVHPDSIVCIIEAMKVFTDIPAGVSGTIAAILVKKGQAVEFGQPLFRVIPNVRCPPMFQRILVANRGEIALRVIRACKELDIEVVAVYSQVDRDAPYLAQANRAICIGKGPSSDSYLNRSRIIAAAEVADVQAIHPGYGFLSENPTLRRSAGRAVSSSSGRRTRRSARWA